MRTRKATVLAAAALCISFLGCVPLNKFDVKIAGDFAATPPGRCAVLAVTARPEARAKTHGFEFTAFDTRNAEARFAELLAYAASQEGGLDVLSPRTVAERVAALADKGAPAAGDHQALLNGAQALGLASYLTAHVDFWKLSSAFFVSVAEVRYKVDCYKPGSDLPVWHAEVFWRARGTSDRQAALESLREMFRRLKGALPRAGP